MGHHRTRRQKVLGSYLNAIEKIEQHKSPQISPSKNRT